MDYLEKKDDKEYQIKKLILTDDTVIEPNYLTHISIIKNKQNANEYDFKISYGYKSKNDLLALSNQCNKMAHVFKFMREYNIEFDHACIMYDKGIEKGRKEKNETY